MDSLVNYFKNEPVRTIALIELIIGLMVLLEIIQPEVGGGIMGLIAAYNATSTRQKVTPLATLAPKLERAKDPGDTRTGEQIAREIFDGDV